MLFAATKLMSADRLTLCLAFYSPLPPLAVERMLTPVPDAAADPAFDLLN